MPPPPPWLSPKSSKAAQAKHSAPMSPTIKKEPGTEESPHVIAQADPMPRIAKRKTRSDSHSGVPSQKRRKKGKVGKLNPERERKVKASETWQYISSLLSTPITIPTFPKTIRAVLRLPRQRDLPEAWKLRLASETPTFKILALLINYLNGSATNDILCGSSAANCAAKWMTTGPAIASLEEGKGIIYKDCAFPRCVFFPLGQAASQPSDKKTCCNAFYRDNSDRVCMPDIWSPSNPTPAPAAPRASSPSSSSFIKKEPGTEEAPIAQHTSKTKNSKREKRSDSPSESGPRKKQKQEIEKPDDESDDENYEELQTRLEASETWQYISRFTAYELNMPAKSIVERFERPRKRSLPIAWKRRLAVEKPNFKIKRLLVDYLTGDEESNYLCSLPGANCREKWETVGPAIDSMQQGKLTIYKEGAFPRCISFESRYGNKRCCNAVYRNATSDFMPAIWPPAPASVPAPASSPASSPVSSSSSSSSSSSASSSASSSSSSAASSSESSSASSSESSSASSPAPSTTVERALSGYPETPRQQIIHEAPAQQEAGLTTSLWEQRNEALYLSGPGNAPTSYAHSAGWLQQRQGQVLPTGTDGSTLQILDLQNTGTTTPLASDFQNLSCIVFEGTVEVILQDVPVFTISRGGHWAVGVGKECRVRNLGAGTKALLYIVGISA